MYETRVFADDYCGVFRKQEDFLECLKSIGRNSSWQRKSARNLRLVAITSGSKVEEEMKERYSDEGLDEEIITDTIVNTGLLLKVRNQYYPVRNCAIKSILDRAGISGAGRSAAAHLRGQGLCRAGGRLPRLRRASFS